MSLLDTFRLEARRPRVPVKQKDAKATDARPLKREAPTPSQPADTRYRPVALYQNVQYSEKGAARDLSKGEVAAFRAISENYEIPSDIEATSYGPLSGISFEQRVIAAHKAGKLRAKPGKPDDAICSTCGKAGHWNTYCPSAFEL